MCDDPGGSDALKMAPCHTQEGVDDLTGQRGGTWTSDGFRTEWGKVCHKVGISDVTFHDLRGTAVTRLALAGCTNNEIASITGHSLTDVNAIPDAHYLGGRIELAEQAMARLEEKEARTETVKPGVKPDSRSPMFSRPISCKPLV